MTGVISRCEGDARAAVTAGARQVQPIDRNRQVKKTFRPWPVWPHQVRMQQAVTKVTRWGAEHRFHVVRREGDMPDDDVAEVGCI